MLNPIVMVVVFNLVGAPLAKGEDIDFARDVLPIFERNCFRCHEGRNADAGRRLDQKRDLLGKVGGDALVIPGNSSTSRLVEVISGKDPETVMPPKGPRLREEEITTIRRWIDEGVAWDLRRLPHDDAAGHWAFLPIRRPSLPQITTSAGPNNPIDVFVAKQHDQLDVGFGSLADRRTLIRRLYATLTGLPPAYEDVRNFVVDASPTAYEALVDRLLASPSYGERWGRHWLDVARWAESEGYESNHPRASAWRYRDYVIDSFNSDRPYDEFVLQQTAGDELANYSPENIVATGFLAAARISSNEEDIWRQRNDVNVDIVNAVGSAFLGLTFQCAQCHDHKFDPLTTRDYYAMQAFFVHGQPVPLRLSEKPVNDEASNVLSRCRKLFEEARYRLSRTASKKLPADERQALLSPADQRNVEQEKLARRAYMQLAFSRKNIESQIAEKDRESYKESKKRAGQLRDSLPRTFAFYSPLTSPHQLDVLPSLGFYPLAYNPENLAKARPYVMIRGDVHSIGSSVDADWPDFLNHVPLMESGSVKHTRRDLANWLTDKANPLVARVWVNRIWHYHFGRGLVSTVDDFGVRGARPTHLELLDWLAAELIESGWSTKHIHRLIVTSRVYQHASSVSDEMVKRDPDNLMLTRWQPRRLEAEAIRDSLLAISGDLNRQIGGPSIAEDDRDDSVRRSVYLFQRRGKPSEMLGLFDGPNECSASQGERSVSTSPLQPLYLLNSQFVLSRANNLAVELKRVVRENVDEAIALAFRRCVQRNPTPDELAASRRLFETLNRAHNEVDSSDERQTIEPLVLFCQAVMNLNEVIYVD